MGQGRLNELLREDQEPFVLQSYIAERRRELGSAPSETQLRLRSLRRLRKRRPTSEKERFQVGLCKNSCFLQFRRDSPEIGKSPPLFGFASPSSRAAGGAVFLQIPARTTALILDAALRIQRQSSPPSKPKFGIFDSIVKRLRSRSRPRSREIEESKKVRLSVKDVLRWDSSAGEISCEIGTFRRVDDRKSGLFSRDRSRPSSAVWSETNGGDKSPDLEASSSGSSRFGDSEDVVVRRDAGECDNVGDSETPFGFVLRRSTYSACRTPELISPENSPSRSKTEDEEKCEMEVLRNGGEEEEKEQCSPVSILDPPFDDDHNGNDDDDFDIESSYEIVERAKLQLMQKLRRFEKLADLDPIELEKKMQENDEEYEEQELQCDDPTASSGWHVPKFLKLLVSDLVSEEEKQESVVDGEEAMRRVVKRLEAWKEVESNTIDMMVDQDFRGELGLWKRCQEQVGEVLAEIEVSIFGVMVEEVWN